MDVTKWVEHYLSHLSGAARGTRKGIRVGGQTTLEKFARCEFVASDECHTLLIELGCLARDFRTGQQLILRHTSAVCRSDVEIEQ
jgi:hypothetical protein